MLNRTVTENRVLSIDIGVKNFAFCLLRCTTLTIGKGRSKTMSSKWEVEEWKCLNLLDDGEEIEQCEETVKSGKKKGELCGKDSKIVTEDGVHYCSRHNPDKEKYKAIVKKEKKVKDFLLQDLCIKLMDTLNEYPHLLQANDVVIEQQLRKSPKNIQMAHLVFSYFVMNGVRNENSLIEKVRFISARNKLKVYHGPEIEVKLKDAKARRKRLAIKYTEYFMSKPGEDLDRRKVWYDYLMKFPKKKDDLSDCFLQGLWWIEQTYNSKKPIDRPTASVLIEKAKANLQKKKEEREKAKDQTTLVSHPDDDNDEENNDNGGEAIDEVEGDNNIECDNDEEGDSGESDESNESEESDESSEESE